MRNNIFENMIPAEAADVRAHSRAAHGNLDAVTDLAAPADLTAKPPDQHVCTTRDDLERSEYDGNLYAYKVLIVNALGQPRSYYRTAAGVWRGGWRDSECLASNDYGVAHLLHTESADPLPGLCECGFHAWYELPPESESPHYRAADAVPVVVQVGGDVLYAARGTRSQHVRVRAVIDAGNDANMRINSGHYRLEGRKYPTRRELAAHFGGVPVLAPEAVETWAAVEGLRPAVHRMQELMREDV